MNNTITKLSDYAALKKLASALWQQDSAYHGAAIMVGAGFSRSAASTGDVNRKLPLWHDFSEMLAKELGSDSTDPLRLAEEYCAYFGKQALHDLIKKAVNDAAWIPGELHKSLLELPWSEVLTTNWDSLLERASTEVYHPVYSIVSKQEDLSSARSPRIVKLHGTIDISKDLIFTQEDYRKYPQNYAAFVNFSRQVFIENELCLLGFSSDDPNFLQWTGWVRDHLSTHARRIYLFGALELSSAKRKYLESINIAPIDLGDLVADHDESNTKYLEAIKIFVRAMQELQPKQVWEWEPAQLCRTGMTEESFNRIHQDFDYAAKLLEKKIPLLQRDRESYPGWLVCPGQHRSELRRQIRDLGLSSKSLSAMATDCREMLLYEVAWRYGVTYEVIPSWLVGELLTVCDPAKNCALVRKQQLEVAILLLKNTRWMDSPESESIKQATSAILERNAKYCSQSNNALAYHHALVARDKFDYPGLEKFTEEIVSDDPIWKLRKASLFAELGQFNKGAELVKDSYKELLNQHSKDRSSVYVISRLAWTHWLVYGIDRLSFAKHSKALPSIYQDFKCSPWDFIEGTQNRITNFLVKQQEQNGIEPLFEPGNYKDNSKVISFSNELHPLLLFDGIAGAVGIPLRWSGAGSSIDFLNKSAVRLLDIDELDDESRFALAIRYANSGTSAVLTKTFSRVQVARFSSEVVAYLFNCCEAALEY